MPSNTLAALERLRFAFGPEATVAKLALLGHFARTRLGAGRSVLRLHEALCCMRAYPDDAAVLAQVQAMLDGFDRRSDLRAHRDALADTGIAGTTIFYRFFAGQAQWLAKNWPDRLRLDRDDDYAEDRIARALPALLTRAEATALAELKLAGYAALDRLRGKGETDAVFLLRRMAALPGDGFTREAFVDTVDASFVLAPGPDTPSRTKARWERAPVVFRREPPPRARPDLRVELLRAPRSVRPLSVRAGAEAIDLARGAMVTRARSLEAFSFGDARDAWLVDDGDGLSFTFASVIPERRHAVVSYYGGLMLRNGVPVGYTQADIAGASAALSFNAFETFRGGEAGNLFARWLAALRGLFGATSFSIEPYQLGADNDEAIASGAWWFYAKFGFAPRDKATLRLAKEEAARARRRATHRTSPAMLRRLAERHVFLDLDRARPRPLMAQGALGMHSGAALSRRAGSDRERGIEEASADLLRHCGLDSLRAFSPAEREAWRRFAPVAALLDIGQWRGGERRGLVEVIRAKAGRSERDFIARYGSHPRLDDSLVAWLRLNGGSDAKPAPPPFPKS